MIKTTKNNPAAFQKVPPLSFLMLLKNLVRKIIHGKNKAIINIFRAELLNYLSQYKRTLQFYCNLCESELPYFLHTANEKRILYNSICPKCSSRKRHRGLNELYKNILAKYNLSKILHFAPEPVFYELFQPFDYLTADLELTDVDYQINIENIDFKADSFDLVLCNHVLEHVSEDNKALKELYRILKPSGTAIITVPGNWSRKNTIEYDYPDGNGHYRDYGLNFKNELSDIFSTIKMVDLYKYNNIYHFPIGLKPQHDLAFICQKN